MIEPPEPYITLGLAMRALRKRSGLTQVEAAAKVGIRSTFISAIENGKRGMRFHTMLALIDAYNADLSDLAAEFKKAS